MSETENWEQEKMRRLQGDSARPLRRDIHRPGNIGVRKDSTGFTVKISTIIAFLIAAFLVMPLHFVGARIFFQWETARLVAVILASTTIYPIGRILERRSWPGSESLGIFKAGVIMAGGGLLVLLLVWVFGPTGVLKKQSDYAAEVHQRNIVSKSQLPLAGYENESETRTYLKKVQETRSLLGSSRPGESDAEYGNYKRVYVDPLKEMGYEFDITLRMAAQRFLVKETHRRSGDDVELLVFNAVCFRNRLLEDEIITPETQKSLSEVAFAWLRTPVPDMGVYMQKLALFDAQCPLTDPGVMYKRQP